MLVKLVGVAAGGVLFTGCGASADPPSPVEQGWEELSSGRQAQVCAGFSSGFFLDGVLEAAAEDMGLPTDEATLAEVEAFLDEECPEG